MQPIIDADTDVAESEAMWEMFDKEMYGRRPLVLSLPDSGGTSKLVKQMQSREDVSPALIEKILCDNPRQYYRI